MAISSKYDYSKSQYPKGNLIDWEGLIWAGSIAGILSLPILFFLLPASIGLDTGSIIQYWASIVLGPNAITYPATFFLTHFIIAIAIHWLLTMVLTLIITSLTHRQNGVWSLVIGGSVGLGYYLLNIYIISQWFNWMYQLQTIQFMFFSIGLGCGIGFLYKSLKTEPWPQNLKKK